MKHIFIINPTAGNKDFSKSYQKEINALFKRKTDEFEIYITEHAAHATQIAKNACENNQSVRIYVFGGDGTVNEVARGVYGYQNCEIGVYPCGSGNDFVRTLGYQKTEILSLVTGVSTPCDMIKVNDSYAINVASVGFDSEVGRNVVRFKRFGKLSYSLSVAYCFLLQTKNTLTISVDEGAKMTGDYLFAVAANGQYYGGGFHPAPCAKLSDALLNFVLIKKVSRFKMLQLIGKYKKGKHLDTKYSNIISHCTGKKMSVCSEKGFYINCDGEISFSKKVHFEILPSATRIILPSKSS